MSKIILPKVFKDMSSDKRYSHLEGKPKISHSQWTSWMSPKYKSDYIKQYMVGIPSTDNVFNLFGSACGTFIESIANNDKECHSQYEHLLSQSDRDILTAIEYPENTVYEDYIVIDMDTFVIEGYADRCIYLPDNKVIVDDFKTGSVAKKKAEYASPDYMQTRLYGYQKENDGYEVVDCKVVMLDRAGNGSEKHPVRLTGKIENVPTPYKKEDVEVFLKNVVTPVVHEISDYYKKYLKFFN